MTTKIEATIGIGEERGRGNEMADLSEKDEAIAMVGEQEHELDPVVVARTVRKIDLCLLPVMMFGFGLCYYDKAILGSAALFGMTTDLQLTVVIDRSVNPPVVDTTRLSWATSIFYFGMLVGLYPLTFALQRFNMGRLLGAIVIIWSAICMATAGVSTHQGLYVQRFFLGFFEGIVPTSFMCIISSYYTQEEQALRQSFWFSATCLFNIIGGGLNYGFSRIPGGSGGGLRSWQYIYLLAGVLTIAFGLVCFATPNSPVTAWFLSDDEKFAAVERLRRNQGGVRCTKIKMSQIKESILRDPKTYLVFIIITAAYTINGAITGFGPLIVTTFNYTPLEAILLQFPLGGLGFTAMLVTGYLGTRYSNIRLIMVVLSCLPVIAGCVMIWKSEWSFHAATPVVGYTITGFWTVVVTLTIATGMSNVAGHTKKSFMSATIFVAYCVGNIVGPLMVRSQSRDEHYPELWLGLIICFIICIVVAVLLYLVLVGANKQKKRALLASGFDETERAKLAFQDLTDMENPYFRYVL
ncbi:Allantoate transport protein [Madurella fahalii]|uniref:Allantoate transport protein n=1 Tax=Madurella fahalii TaxID=1157608 RepID=A0ABQ0GEG9_9PEZI